MAQLKAILFALTLLATMLLVILTFHSRLMIVNVFVTQEAAPQTSQNKESLRLRWVDPQSIMAKFWLGRQKASQAGEADYSHGDVDDLHHLSWHPEHENLDTVQQGNSRHEDGPRPEGRMCALGQDLADGLHPCKAEQLGPRFLPSSTSVIQTPVLPFWPQFFPEIGNGHVATVVQSSTIYMNGLYNGANSASHRARIPSTAAIFVDVVSPNKSLTSMFRLDLGRGVFSENYTGDGFSVEVRRYAHRELTRLLVTEVVLERTTSTLPITLSFTVHSGAESDDIVFVKEESGVWNGRTKEAEYPDIAGTIPVTVVHSLVPPMLTFAPSTQGSVAFLTSVSTSKADAMNSFNEGKARFHKGTLFSSHVNEWEGTWQRGHIEMTGNDTMALNTNAAMYYLLCSLPLKEDALWPFFGMAPGGLAHGAANKDYLGHVFWDQDTWMFPPIALLHGDLGRLIAGTRLRTLGTAMLNANRTFYKGARYPWESAFTGLPTSPSYSCETFEVHVTGDASWMMRQYLQLTNDTDFLAHKGYEAVAGIADFWVSRSTYNKTKQMYEILDVTGPDETHSGVDNSVYTNMVATHSMRTAHYAATLAKQTPKPEWEEVASKMYFDFDPKYEYHPEFDYYKRGTTVKQADVIMLGFPFRWPMTKTVHGNDLTYYATVTLAGPAMTWGIFAVNWLRLGEKKKADEDFYKGTWNIQGPFKVWSENADGTGAYNFQTGMGGYLQSLLYGYLGVDLNDASLNIHPQLPPSLTAMALRGMDYMGGSLDVAYNANQMNITLTQAAHEPLALALKSGQQVIPLKVGTTVTVDRQMAVIQPGS